MPVSHGDGQVVEVMYGGFVADADADFPVPDRHVYRHFNGEENAQHFRGSSKIPCKFIAQM